MTMYRVYNEGIDLGGENMIKVLSIGENYIKEGNYSVNNEFYEGGVTKNPIETYHYIIQHRPDVIVMSTKPGDIETLTVYQRIRNMYAGKYIPFIILVHEEDELLYESYYEDGITIGLEPEVSEEALYLHIEQIVNRCRKMRKKILLVDKDPVVLHTYRHFLGGKYKIYTASNIEEAIDCLRRETIHVLISSIATKDNMELNFLQLLQENERWKEIPNIIQIDPENIELMPIILSYGVSDCLIKPVDKEALLDHVRVALGEQLYPSLAITGEKRILLVDKKGVSFYSIKNSLKGHYNTLYASPGVRAVSILEVEHIDGIILNLDNAYFCLSKIIEKAQIKNIPILLFTSNKDGVDTSIKQKTNNASCINCVMELPVNRKILLDKLELAI